MPRMFTIDKVYSTGLRHLKAINGDRPFCEFLTKRSASFLQNEEEQPLLENPIMVNSQPLSENQTMVKSK